MTSGKHVRPRVVVQLPVAADEVALWRASAKADGVTFVAWLIEAARAYYKRREGRR